MRIVCLLAALVLFSPAAARADGGPFGLGLIVGSPTGLTGAYHLSDRTAIDAALGFDLIDDRDFYLHVEFLYYLPTLVSGSSVSLDAYLGIGGYVRDHKDGRFGARGPFGLSLGFTAAPLEIFGEAAVFMQLVPDVDIAVGGALGFRYYF